MCIVIPELSMDKCTYYNTSHFHTNCREKFITCIKICIHAQDNSYVCSWGKTIVLSLNYIYIISPNQSFLSTHATGNYAHLKVCAYLQMLRERHPVKLRDISDIKEECEKASSSSEYEYTFDDG